jgi:tetratricopeptide (TPR) repeat protein
LETQPTQEQLDALLREANILRMRGQAQAAEERCRAALELSPGDSSALEMLGDFLRERGRLEEAAEQYRQAATAAPERPSPERKFAEITLELAEQQRLRDAAAFMLANPRSPKEQRRNVYFALFLSSIFPGLGQFYNQELIKGGCLVAGALLCLVLGGDALFRLVFTVAAMRNSGPVNQYGAWFGMLGLVLWLYAVVDAVVTAQKRNAGRAG